MPPLNQLTEIELGTSLTIYDEYGNRYTGELNWDSNEEVHKINEHKLVSKSETNGLFIVKPIEDTVISGFLAKVERIVED